MPTRKPNNKLNNSNKKCHSCTISLADNVVSYRVLLFKLLEIIINYWIKCVVTLADWWSGSVYTTARRGRVLLLFSFWVYACIMFQQRSLNTEQIFRLEATEMLANTINYNKLVIQCYNLRKIMYQMCSLSDIKI